MSGSVRPGRPALETASSLEPSNPHRSWDWLRAVLSWPARTLDRWTPLSALPNVSVAERHRRLQVASPPEGWLALQQGLSTVGNDQTWTSFVPRGGTALSVGGVHGPDRVAAFTCFREETQRLGMTRQAVYPVREPDLAAARTVGFEVFPIGVEAWVDLAEFSMRGKRFADLRQMRNRARSRGVEVLEVEPAVWRGALSTAWRRFEAARGVPWKIRWLSGGPVDDASWGHRTFVAHREGVVQAFCTMLPGPEGTLSLDVMCRDPDAIPGSMERLLVDVLEQLRDEGHVSVSLGPSPLAGDTAGRVGGVMGAAMRWAWTSEAANRWFGFQRLASFKAKFRPRHEMVYLGLAPGWSWLSLYLAARIWVLDD